VFNAEWKRRIPVWHSRIIFGASRRRRLGNLGEVHQGNTAPSAAGRGSKMTLKPKQPIVGAGVTWTDTDTELKADWTGLEEATPDCETPNQMHPVCKVEGGCNHGKSGFSDKSSTRRPTC
jgi:hypothetical protein